MTMMTYDKEIQICHQLGYSECEPLGHGSFGKAIRIGNGQVLKLTNSQQEFVAGSLLKGNFKLAPYFAIVYEYKFINMTIRNSEYLFGIVLEELDMDKNRNELKQFDKIFKSACFTTEIVLYGKGRTWTDIHKYFVEGNEEILSDIYGRALILIEAEENSIVLKNILDTTFNAFKVLAKELPDCEIDFQAANRGYSSDGHLKFFDITLLR